MPPLSHSTDFDLETNQFLRRCQVQPRAYQQRIIRQTLENFARESTTDSPRTASIVIESPTGSGKTLMGLAIAAMIQKQTAARIDWVAMRRNLLTQAAEENRRRGFGGEIEFISMFERNPPEVDRLINLATARQ